MSIINRIPRFKRRSSSVANITTLATETAQNLFQKHSEELLNIARQSVQESIASGVPVADGQSPSYTNYVAMRKEQFTRSLLSEMLMADLRQNLAYDAELRQLAEQYGPDAIAQAIKALRSPLPNFDPASAAAQHYSPPVPADGTYINQEVETNDNAK